MKITPREKRRHAFLAWGDFHARSRFARSAISEEKWGTTRSLTRKLCILDLKSREWENNKMESLFTNESVKRS